jgi:stringent starvation protein B
MRQARYNEISYNEIRSFIEASLGGGFTGFQAELALVGITSIIRRNMCLIDSNMAMIYHVVTTPVTQQHLQYKKMTDSKIYLNVPFAQKDQAKALGARWDGVQKKWHVPANKDIALFARWQTDLGAVIAPIAKTQSSKISSSAKTSSMGVKTEAQDKGFVAYSGALPPWD